jgi:hypothetical protein
MSRPRSLAGRFPTVFAGGRVVGGQGSVSGFRLGPMQSPGRSASRPCGDGLPRSRCRSGGSASRPPGPARAALLGRGDRPLHDGSGVGLIGGKRGIRNFLAWTLDSPWVRRLLSLVLDGPKGCASCSPTRAGQRKPAILSGRHAVGDLLAVRGRKLGTWRARMQSVGSMQTPAEIHRC